MLIATGRHSDMTENHQIVQLESFEPYVGTETIERILTKSSRLRDLRVVHVNSTY